MKNLLFAPVLIATLAIASFAQSKSVAATQKPSNGTRVRVLGRDGTGSDAAPSTANGLATSRTTSKVDFNNHTETSRVRRTSPVTENGARSVELASNEGSSDGDLFEKSTTEASSSSPLATTQPNLLMASTQVYRIGANDVLDIQLSGDSSRRSTLFTVLSGGLLEYPLAGDPIPVAGMTTAEVAGVLRQRIKIFENPMVAVKVREYASHNVTITGFVAAPGTKALRREAVPLYAMLAEVMALPEAGRATITRQGRQPMVLDLKDPNHSSTLVLPGDVIKVLGAPPPPTEFFFVGEGLNSPGQKPYHAGLTLTQAILASGGLRVSAGWKIRISRQRDNGRLANETFDLRKIQGGKTPDPVLQKGDRIEVIGNN